MTAPRCLACDVAFKPNRTLAALPHGRRIAFDPLRGRVWRLCAACGEWNLVGEDDTPSALAELAARFPLPGTGVQSHRHSATLEVLHIHDLAASTPGDLAIAGRRDRLRTASRTARWMKWGILGTVVAGTLWVTGFPPVLLGMLGGGLASGQLTRVLRRRRRTGATDRLRLSIGLGGAALLTGAIVAGGLRGGPLAGALAFTVLLGPLDLLFARLLPIVRRLPSGRGVAVPEDGGGIEITWRLDPAAIALRPPGEERWLPPEDSAVLLRHLVDIGVPRLSHELLREAGTLASAHGTRGVLSALDVWRKDRDDTLTLDDLPLAYLVALDLAFSRDDAHPVPLQIEHERLLEAARVADEVELLRRGDDGPA